MFGTVFWRSGGACIGYLEMGNNSNELGKVLCDVFGGYLEKYLVKYGA